SAITGSEILDSLDDQSGKQEGEEEEEQAELEAEELFSYTDDELRSLRSIQELDRTIARIELLQAEILLRQQMMDGDDERQPKAEEATISEAVQQMRGLTLEEEEIRSLKRDHFRQQCEIDEIVCCYRSMKTFLDRIVQELCGTHREMKKTRRLSKAHQKWVKDTTNELNHCRQQHQDLAAAKLTKKMAFRVTKKNMARDFHYSRRFLRRGLLNRHLQDFHHEIDELKVFSAEIAKEIGKRLDKIESK
ncbi:hypothetical protein KR009_003660, partial [Drosophila setifemur]